MKHRVFIQHLFPGAAASSSTPTTCYSKEESLATTPEIQNLKRLPSRIVELTRLLHLRQILEEVEVAKRRYGKLNTIVMNAVMEACVHCNDVDAALGIFDEMDMLEESMKHSAFFSRLNKVLRWGIQNSLLHSSVVC